MSGFGYQAYPSDPYAATYGGFATPGPFGGVTSRLDDVRTVFITGFPDDVKERELNNLLRFLPGYVASQMNWKNGQAQGFALFDTVAGARAAVEIVGQIRFDENAVLRCEMAHKNMFLKDDPLVKKTRLTGSLPMSPLDTHSAYIGSAFAQPAATPMPPQGFAPVMNIRDNPPCNTLFVGNLGDNVNEAELRSLFGSRPGFKQLKVVKNGKSTTCFVELVDVPSAIGVHQELQGAVLSSSDRGGIRIQFSKNPFGKRKDFE